ncbi:MAG: dihydroorotate dehydrogenase-like protein [Propionibacteriaceae bacterium]|nr:dihydroorotate dehydrogenase-like protein [Propionibacteriaceae bacterium]
MMDLTTNYMGLSLRNPLVASAGPLSQTVSGVRELADAGVGAVVMYSLFEEQMRREAEQMAELEVAHEESFPEALSYFPNMPYAADDTAVTAYLRLVESAADAIEVPLIASLNGSTLGGWVKNASRLVDAGAAAIELNIYLVPGDTDVTGSEVELRHIEILQAVRESVAVPVAVKLSPYFSSVGNMCVALDHAGADGLVMFNRFLQPDIDIDRMDVVPGVTLSSRDDARLPRTWIAVLHGRVKASLAASSGVETPSDVVKYILAGADIVMTTSSLVRHGAKHAEKLLEGLESWLVRKELTLEKARGLLAVPKDVDASGYERAGYVAALEKAKNTYGSLR